MVAHLIPPSLVYGDVAVTIAADLLIRDSERRCAAVLLRLSGRRFADPKDPEPAEVSFTQADLAGAANLRAVQSRACCSGWRYGGSSNRATAASSSAPPPRCAPLSMRNEGAGSTRGGSLLQSGEAKNSLAKGATMFYICSPRRPEGNRRVVRFRRSRSVCRRRSRPVGKGRARGDGQAGKADRRPFEPRRFGRLGRGARRPDGKAESPGNGAAKA